MIAPIQHRAAGDFREWTASESDGIRHASENLTTSECRLRHDGETFPILDPAVDWGQAIRTVLKASDRLGCDGFLLIATEAHLPATVVDEHRAEMPWTTLCGHVQTVFSRGLYAAVWHLIELQICNRSEP